MDKTKKVQAMDTQEAGKSGKAGIAYRVLKSRHFTEKTAGQEALGKYTFMITADASKGMVAQAVKEVFGVVPASVRIVKIEGKTVRRGRKTGRKSDIKKAIVTLKPGVTLPAGEAK